MDRDEVDELVDGVETIQPTFLDLPDDILHQFFEYLDIPSRLKLRLNKRLLRLYDCVKHKLDNIAIKIDKDELRVKPSYLLPPLRSLQNGQMVYGFDLVTRNTYVHKIDVSLKELNGSNDWNSILLHNERIRRIIDTLATFEADSLIVDFVPCGITVGVVSVNVRINLSTLFVFAQNIRCLHLEVLCNSLTSQDLCTIRETMKEGDCKLESFHVMATEYTRNYFMQDCFGVSINFRVLPTAYFERYSSTDDSIELYTDQSLPRHNVTHFEGDFQTSVHKHPSKRWYQIAFKKGNIDAKPDSEDKIKLNQFYQWSN